MSAIKRISRFKLWQVKREGETRGELLSELIAMLNEVRGYMWSSDVGIPNRLPSAMSFRDALMYLSEHAGLTAVESTSDFLREGVLVACIARDKKADQPVVVVPYSQHNFLIINTIQKKKFLCASKNIAVGFDEFVLLFPKPHLKNVTHGQQASSLRRYFPLVDVLFLSLIAVACTSTCLLMSASLLSDYGIANRVPLIGLVAASLVFLSCAYHEGVFIAKKNRALVSFTVAHDFLRRVFSRSYEDFSKLTPQTFSSYARALHQQSNAYFVNRYRFIASWLFIPILASFAVISMALSACFVAFYAVLFAVMALLKRADARHHAHEHQAIYELAQDFERYNRSMLALKGLHVSTMLTHTIKSKHDRVQDASSRAALFAFMLDATYFFVPVASALICVLWLSTQADNVPPWQRLFWLLLSMLMGLLAAGFINYVSETFTMPTDKKVAHALSEWISDDETRVEPVNIVGTIELINVSFQYEQSPLIIKNQSFLFEERQFHVIQGASGAGKSTLLKVVMGMLKPSDGHVVIDGQDMRSLNTPSLRRHFGVVFSDSQLFSGSVFDNIMCGRSIPIKQLERLLLSHQVFDYLIDMPMGLETYIFWHQKNVSRFEQKLILLARALVHEPRVLFLDEMLHDLPGEHRAMLEDYLASLPITRVLTSLGPLLTDHSHRVITLL